jgi:hypothetical protein
MSPSTAARLATQLECLPALLEGAPPAGLDRRTRSGKWSVRENLAHLARHHQVMLDRVRKVLAEDRPRLPRYAAEEDAEWPAWAALPADEVRRRLTALRTELRELVCALDEKQLGRTAVHPIFGEMALALWIELFLLHEAHHLYVVMKRARGGE